MNKLEMATTKFVEALTMLPPFPPGRLESTAEGRGCLGRLHEYPLRDDAVKGLFAYFKLDSTPTFLLHPVAIAV